MTTNARLVTARPLRGVVLAFPEDSATRPPTTDSPAHDRPRSSRPARPARRPHPACRTECGRPQALLQDVDRLLAAGREDVERATGRSVYPRAAHRQAPGRGPEPRR